MLNIDPPLLFPGRIIFSLATRPGHLRSHSCLTEAQRLRSFRHPLYCQYSTSAGTRSFFHMSHSPLFNLRVLKFPTYIFLFFFLVPLSGGSASSMRSKHASKCLGSVDLSLVVRCARKLEHPPWAHFVPRLRCLASVDTFEHFAFPFCSVWRVEEGWKEAGD
ncbi:hypothetical protein IWX50DRAFT_409496 [Phyllosticta citricarpa]